MEIEKRRDSVPQEKTVKPLKEWVKYYVAELAQHACPVRAG